MATTKHEFLARSITVAFALAAVGLVATACGTTVINNTTNCGIGTTLVNGTCVGTAIDAGGDTTAVGPDGEVTIDGSPLADTGADAQPIEPDDPCPVPSAAALITNCDPKCGAVDMEVCQRGICSSTTEQQSDHNGFNPWYSQPQNKTKWILRLPADPWLLFGECDPDGKRDGSTAYALSLRELPQPKFFVSVVLTDAHYGLKPGGVPVMQFSTDGKLYKTRMMPSVFGEGPTPRKINSRVQPLAKPLQPWPQESYRVSCAHYDFADFLPPVINLDLGLSGVTFNLLYATSRAHIPATNIEFNDDVNACTVQP
jgi:hypothetical protein